MQTNWGDLIKEQYECVLRIYTAFFATCIEIKLIIYTMTTAEVDPKNRDQRLP